MRREFKYMPLAALALALLIFQDLRYLPFQKNIEAQDEVFYVTHALDGDTLRLSDGRKVRLIGVDTPEVYYSDKLLRDARKTGKDITSIQELGKKASAFTKSLCEGKKVRLEFDVEKHDRYGRWLAYAYLEDGTFLNAKIIEEGYGQVMTIPPNVKYAEYFLKLQKEARNSRKGLWGKMRGNITILGIC